MSPRAFRLILLAASMAPVLAHAAVRELTFEKDVRPILKAHCTHCHGEEEKPEGGVDLRLRRFMDKALDDGCHVLVAGKPGDSEMVRLIRAGKMPKKGKKVSADELAIIERWILEGAHAAKPEPETLAPGPVITDDERAFWA